MDPNERQTTNTSEDFNKLLKMVKNLLTRTASVEGLYNNFSVENDTLLTRSSELLADSMNLQLEIAQLKEKLAAEKAMRKRLQEVNGYYAGMIYNISQLISDGPKANSVIVEAGNLAGVTENETVVPEGAVSITSEDMFRRLTDIYNFIQNKKEQERRREQRRQRREEHLNNLHDVINSTRSLSSGQHVSSFGSPMACMYDPCIGQPSLIVPDTVLGIQRELSDYLMAIARNSGIRRGSPAGQGLHDGLIQDVPNAPVPPQTPPQPCGQLMQPPPTRNNLMTQETGRMSTGGDGDIIYYGISEQQSTMPTQQGACHVQNMQDLGINGSEGDLNHEGATNPNEEMQNSAESTEEEEDGRNQ